MTVTMTSGDGFPHQDLERLGRHVRHVQQESKRQADKGSTRRRLTQEAKQLATQFELLVDRWVQEENVAADWRRFLYEGAPAPDGPRFATGPLFKGTTMSAGATLEIQHASDGGYDIVVDGSISRHESVPWHLDPDMIGPVKVGEYDCVETFSASDEAVRALRRFTTSEVEPPWRWGRELVEDGLITAAFQLTPRGKRRLAGTPQGAQPETPGAVTYAVVAIDGARARTFLLEVPPESEPDTTLTVLAEVGHATHPERRARLSQVLSDTRPGQRREGPDGPRHGVSDRRDNYRQVSQERFAGRAMQEVVELWDLREPGHIVLVAPPQMLGQLRPLVARYAQGHPDAQVHELARDLTWMQPAALHDALASAGILPARARLT